MNEPTSFQHRGYELLCHARAVEAGDVRVARRSTQAVGDASLPRERPVQKKFTFSTQSLHDALRTPERSGTTRRRGRPPEKAQSYHHDPRLKIAERRSPAVLRRRDDGRETAIPQQLH